MVKHTQLFDHFVDMARNGLTFLNVTFFVTLPAYQIYYTKLTLNPLSANSTKPSNILKQFVGGRIV